MKKNARLKIEQQPLIDRLFKTARPVSASIKTLWWQVHTMQRQLAAQVKDDDRAERV